MENLLDFFASWGYGGMFLAAFLAGSVVPIGSEVLFVLQLNSDNNPLLMLLAATLGNTLGGMTCYWMGMLGKREWIHRWLGVSQEKLDKASSFLQGRGAWMGFFAFLPYIGEAYAVVLGIMRANQGITAFSMMLGKAFRYGIILLVSLGFIEWF